MTSPNETLGLFDDSQQKTTTISTEMTLLYPTNHMNLQEILSTGFLKPLEGYPREKHYRDVLDFCPGRLPLFIDHIPRPVLKVISQEQRYLMPVVLKIESSQLSGGPVTVVNAKGKATSVTLPANLEPEALALLVEGVLPLSLVQDISFESLEAKKKFQKDIKQMANVDISLFTLRSKKGLFGKRSPLDLEALRELSPPPQKAEWRDYLVTEAVGGVTAQLLLSAQAGTELRQLVEAAFHNPPVDLSSAPESLHQAIRAIPAWLRGDKLPELKGVESQVFWALVDKLAQKQHRDEPPTRGIIRLLQEMADSMEDHLRGPLKKRALDIQGLTSFGDESVEDFFESSKSVLSGLLLFLLCKNSPLLMAPEPGGWSVDDNALLVARILCGAWEGWTELPITNRGHRGVADSVSYAMTAFHNRRHGSELDLGEPPQLPPPKQPKLNLSELFEQSDWKKRSVQAAALAFCRKMKWACIRTVIPLSKGSYTLEVGGGTPKLVSEGDLKAQYEVDRKRFLHELDTVDDDLIPKQVSKAAFDALVEKGP